MSNTILKSGIHANVPMADYIRDPAPAPSLSTGTVRRILNRSPKHAWLGHPRLGGGDDTTSRRSEFGSAAHQTLLGGSQAVVWCDVLNKDGEIVSDYKTKAAQKFRDDALAEGRTPMLVKHKETITSMVDVAREALAKLVTVYGEPLVEQTLIWEDEGVWCRSRPDLILPGAEIDYKTATDAEPNTWIKTALAKGGYDLQGVHAARGIAITSGDANVDRAILYLVQEDAEPYACSIIGLGPEWEDHAQRKLAVARRVWRECLASEDWRAYGSAIHWADLPSYEETAFENRQASLMRGES